MNYEDSQKIAINIPAKMLIYDNAQHIKSNKILFSQNISKIQLFFDDKPNFLFMKLTEIKSLPNALKVIE